MKKRKGVNLVLIVILIVAVAAIVSFYIVNLNLNQETIKDCETMPINEMNLINYKNLAMHIHPQLKISILSKEQIIPQNIGLSDNRNIMRPIHTHDNAGYLHTESPCLRNFTLNDFFIIYNKSFNSNCIFEYCANNTNTLKMYVNDIQNSDFENLVLKDNDVIKIVYE